MSPFKVCSFGKVYEPEKAGLEQRREGRACHLVVQDLKHTPDSKRATV